MKPRVYVAQGDPEAARDRLTALGSVTPLAATQEALRLAARLIDEGAVPPAAADDAAHIAIAVANGIDYLVTWNYRHIVNAAIRSGNHLLA